MEILKINLKLIENFNLKYVPAEHCFLTTLTRYAEVDKSKLIPENVELAQCNCIKTGVGLVGPLSTTNLALNEPKP